MHFMQILTFYPENISRIDREGIGCVLVNIVFFHSLQKFIITNFNIADVISCRYIQVYTNNLLSI